ncbi:hypothetical protein FACS1894216_20920 [Synergistales bacterium]|nr:hypothetical protein FACS1894216_20920 [Synergistales bacterium]
MSEDNDQLPGKEEREQGSILSKVLSLVPLFELILHIIEFILDLWR